MRKALMVVLILSAAVAWAQGGCTGQKPLNGMTTGGFLKGVANASVRVCSDSLTPCTTIALYSDAALTQSISNPVTTDATGNYQYCASSGSYNEQISGSGFSTVNNTPVTIAGAGIGAQMVSHNLIADYPMTAGTGTTLADSTNNHNDGTFAAGAASPTWTTFGLSFTGTQDIALPAGVNTAKTVVACGTFPNNANQYTNPALLVSTSGTAGLNLFLNNTRSKILPMMSTYGAGARVTSGSIGAYGTHCLTYVLSTTADRLYVDDSESGSYDVKGASFGKQSGTWQLGGGTQVSSAWLQGTLYWVRFYDAELTAAEVAQNYKALRQQLEQRGVNFKVTRSAAVGTRFIAVGDSLSYGFVPSAPADPYTGHLTTNETITTANKVNIALPGMTCADLNANFDNYVLPNISTVAKNVVNIWCGTNDISTYGTSVSETYQSLFGLAQKVRAAGGKAMVMTMISRTGQDANKNLYNALLRPNWPNFADSLCDLAALAPNLGADNAYLNATYFNADGTHLTSPTGYTLVGTTVSGCYNQFTGRASNDLLYGSTQTTITGNAADQVMCSVTIPANTVPPGGGLRGKIVFQKVGGTGSWTFKWNVTPTLSYAAAAIASTANEAEIWIRNNVGSSTAQKAYVYPLWGTTGSALAGATYSGSLTNNFTTDTTLTFTGNAANTESLNVQMCNFTIENP